MNQGFTYTDHKDIDLQVTLKTGAIRQGLRCSLLRTYSEQYDTCDAHALIYYYCINELGVNHRRRVEPDSFELFKAPDGRSWEVESYKENSPPEAPGLIFRLKAMETDDNDIEPDFNYSRYGNDIYEGVDWGDPSTFNQAAWDNVPDRD